MMSQFAFTAGGAAVALALGEGDGQGVVDGVGDTDGDADGLGPGEAVDDALGLGAGEAVGDALGLGAVGAIADAVGVGVGSPLSDCERRWLPVAADVPPPAAEGDADAVGPVAADARTAGPTQESAGLLDELSMVLACGTSTKTRPAATTTASTAISAGYARRCLSP